MLMVTTETIPGVEFEVIGVVKGNMILAKNMFADIGQGFKSMFGGQLKSYTKLMNDSREKATELMIEEAQKVGADAIVCLRYSTSAVMAGAAEVIAYGTAVKFR